jgi:hypothetical protein
MHLFLIRHFNDVDHFTPIVWRMQASNLPVAIYCLNPKYDIKGDYRLRFLKKKGVKVSYVYDASPRFLGLHHFFLRLFIRCCFYLARKDFGIKNKPLEKLHSTLQNYFYVMGRRHFKNAKKKYYNLEWADHFLKASKATVLCFDWIRSHKYVVDVLIKSANGASVPVLSLPHGVFLYTNDDPKEGISKEIEYDKYNRFDHVAVQNRLFRQVIASSGVHPDKIAVLGSARYCDEWSEVNRQIIPRSIQDVHGNGSESKFRVVFMTTRPQYRINVQQVEKTFDMLSQLDNCEVVIKPHTRTGVEADMYRNVKISDVSHLSSVELCEWADVVLVIASSILIESLKLNKPSLYLKYLHQNTTEYEELNACWTIHNDQELLEALSSLQNDVNSVPYSQANVNRFFEEIIYGGRDKHDVLNNYQKFVTSGGQYRLQD